MLVGEPSLHDNVAVVMPLFLDEVVTLGEELARSVAVEVGSEGDAVQSVWHDMLCAQGACFLGCTCLYVKVDSS
jgi:hypothetical protein